MKMMTVVIALLVSTSASEAADPDHPRWLAGHWTPGKGPPLSSDRNPDSCGMDVVTMTPDGYYGHSNASGRWSYTAGKLRIATFTVIEPGMGDEVDVDLNQRVQRTSTGYRYRSDGQWHDMRRCLGMGEGYVTNKERRAVDRAEHKLHNMKFRH